MSKRDPDEIVANRSVKRSKRLAIFHQRILRGLWEHENMSRGDEESDDVKAGEAKCSKCRDDGGDDGGDDDRDASKYPHIEDLCPADKRRIAQLVKHLAKCTKEMREAKSELAVSETEKGALRDQYNSTLEQREEEKRRLESELREARNATAELKGQISRALELLISQIAAQEKQFADLGRTVRGLLRERTRLQNALTERELRIDDLKARMQRAEENRKMEKLLLAQKRARELLESEKVSRACQTDQQAERLISDRFSKSGRGVGETLGLREEDRKRTKSKDDLEDLTVEGTLVRDLFFRNPSVEESGSLELIPALCEIPRRTDCFNSFPFV